MCHIGYTYWQSCKHVIMHVRKYTFFLSTKVTVFGNNDLKCKKIIILKIHEILPFEGHFIMSLKDISLVYQIMLDSLTENIFLVFSVLSHRLSLCSHMYSNTHISQYHAPIFFLSFPDSLAFYSSSPLPFSSWPSEE